MQNPQNSQFLCGLGRCHDHACEALAVPSVTARFERRLIEIIVFQMNVFEMMEQLVTCRESNVLPMDLCHLLGF